mmetsp:Transcript_22339/g.46570  ORF Transcript_22339/g.46570 Transcript_22339/m.46570 type:complete len:108 (-) Transcript_22339:919-1242(-)
MPTKKHGKRSRLAPSKSIWSELEKGRVILLLTLEDVLLNLAKNLETWAVSHPFGPNRDLRRAGGRFRHVQYGCSNPHVQDTNTIAGDPLLLVISLVLGSTNRQRSTP